VIDIRRTTPLNGREVDYNDTSTLTEEDLDGQTNQLLFVAQEVEDGQSANMQLGEDGTYDAVSARIKNVATPTAATDAANKAYVDTKTDEAINSASAAAASAEVAEDEALAASESALEASTAASVAGTARDEAQTAAASLDTSVFIRRDGTQGPTADQDFGSHSLTTTGSVTANSFVGDGSGLTGLPISELEARLAAVEVNLAINTLRDVIDAGWTLTGMVDGFADAFSDQDGVNATDSVNLTYNSSDDKFITNSGDVTQTGGHTESATVGLDGVTVFDRSFALTNDSIIHSVRIYGTSAKSVSVKIALENSATDLDIVVDETFSHTGSGWETFSLSSEYTVPSSGTYRLGSYASGNWNRTVESVAQSYRSGNSTGTGETYTSTTNVIRSIEALSYGAAGNTTVVSASQTASSAPVAGRIVFVLEPGEAITLDTDVIAEFSRSAGEWTAGTLSLEAAYDGTRNVYATDEIDLTGQTSGTAPAIRFRTNNEKDVALHAWAAQWR
jgi:hypothetical protein